MENSGKLRVGSMNDDGPPEWFVAMGESWIGPLSIREVAERIASGELTWAHYCWKAGQGDWKRICDLNAFRATVPAPPEKRVLQEIRTQTVKPESKTAKPESKTSKTGKTRPPRNSNQSARQPPPGVPKSTRNAPESGTSSPRVRPVFTKWFLFYEETQFGPFLQDEIERAIQSGQIRSTSQAPAFAWKEGMEDWKPLSELPEFSKILAEFRRAHGNQADPNAQDPRKVAVERRAYPRRPLVARVFVVSETSGSSGEAATDSPDLVIGLCRDLSVGGMQVLTDRIPGKVGARIRLNVSPPETSAGSRDGQKPQDVFDAFVAEGVIVRVLEDKRGFSFRFHRLSEASRHAIESYIQSTESSRS